MTKIKYRFKGHESFILREGWLNKGMREVRNDPFVFSQNYGADVLGVGPNMATVCFVQSTDMPAFISSLMNSVSI